MRWAGDTGSVHRSDRFASSQAASAFRIKKGGAGFSSRNLTEKLHVGAPPTAVNYLRGWEVSTRRRGYKPNKEVPGTPEDTNQ